MGTPSRNTNSGNTNTGNTKPGSDQSGCGCTGNQSSSSDSKTSTGTPIFKSDDTQRTGPSTGNSRGNDLPSQSKTQRDTRTVEGSESKTPGRDAEGSEVTGSQGTNAPEAIDAD